MQSSILIELPGNQYISISRAWEIFCSSQSMYFIHITCDTSISKVPDISFQGNLGISTYQQIWNVWPVIYNYKNIDSIHQG